MLEKVTAQSLIKDDIKFTTNGLREKAISLQFDLQRVVRIIDEYNETKDVNELMSINGLGEVQSSGYVIDTMCSEVRALMKALSHVDAIERLNNK